MSNRLSQTLRIIGGTYRSRKFSFPNLPGVRPTPDRVRETLFNWLTPHMNGAHCLDLFSGSGALGFEALSRGAAYVTMIDQSPIVIAHLSATAKQLQATQVLIRQAKIPDSTFLSPKPFDIVFLDPPFHQHFIPQCCEWLEQQHLITSQSLIYIERERALYTPPIPSHWQILKSKKTSQIHYCLVRP